MNSPHVWMLAHLKCPEHNRPLCYDLPQDRLRCPSRVGPTMRLCSSFCDNAMLADAIGAEALGDHCRKHFMIG